MNGKRNIQCLAYLATMMLAVACGQTHYVSNFQQRTSIVDGTPSNNDGVNLTPINPNNNPLPNYFIGPPIQYAGLSSIAPFFETSCQPDGYGGIWNPACSGKLLCQALSPLCVNFGQRLLSKAEATARIKWARDCKAATHPDVAAAMSTASTMGTASGVVCGLYPVGAREVSPGHFVEYELPTTNNVPCGSVPADVVIYGFCSSQNQ